MYGTRLVSKVRNNKTHFDPSQCTSLLFFWIKLYIGAQKNKLPPTTTFCACVFKAKAPFGF